MPPTSDDYRLYLDELYALSDKLKDTTFRDLKDQWKENLWVKRKNELSEEDINKLLEPRKHEFDYKLHRIVQKFGIAPGDLREHLDTLWNGHHVGLRELGTWDYRTMFATIENVHRFKLKRQKWHTYVDAAIAYASDLWKKQYGDPHA